MVAGNVAGCPLPVARCRLPVAVWRLPVAGCVYRLPVVGPVCAKQFFDVYGFFGVKDDDSFSDGSIVSLFSVKITKINTY